MSCQESHKFDWFFARMGTHPSVGRRLFLRGIEGGMVPWFLLISPSPQRKALKTEPNRWVCLPEVSEESQSQVGLYSFPIPGPAIFIRSHFPVVAPQLTSSNHRERISTLVWGAPFHHFLNSGSPLTLEPRSIVNTKQLTKRPDIYKKLTGFDKMALLTVEILKLQIFI